MDYDPALWLLTLACVMSALVLMCLYRLTLLAVEILTLIRTLAKEEGSRGNPIGLNRPAVQPHQEQ